MTTPIVKILEPEMRQRFNDGRYWERVQSGELRTEEWDSRHPSLTAAHEPYCTRSLMLALFDQDNNEIARVHLYRRPDGTIGASGRPDPKRLFENGTLYRLVKRRDRAVSPIQVPEISQSPTPTPTTPTSVPSDAPKKDE